MQNFNFNPYAPRFTPSSQIFKKLSKTPFEADINEYSFFGIHGVDVEFAKPKSFNFNPNASSFIPASQRLNKPSKTPFDAHGFFLATHGADVKFRKSKSFTFNPYAPRFIPASQRLNKHSKTLSPYQRPVPDLPSAERIFWYQVMQQEAVDEEYYQEYLKKMAKEFTRK